MLVAVIVIVTVLLVAALAVWFFVGQNPAQGEGGPPSDEDTTSDRFYHRSDRPAGPDAEPMSPYADPRPERSN
jgi:hypothetical protein